MWTTNPDLAKLLANPKDGYKYTQNSNEKLVWKCPNCGNIIKNKGVCQINKYGLSCARCSDHISYPEKFMFNVLKQLLNDNFVYQYNPSWCIYELNNKNRKGIYDFYFKINNEEYIIETHGIQHYQESFSRYYGRSLQEEQENDKIKKELAIENKINKENYIVIDCRKSELEWIKNNILKSKLNKLFDFSKVDWLKCHEYTCNSLVKQTCNLWNSGMHSTKEIGKILKLNKTTICRYLKCGNKFGWCSYNVKLVKKYIAKKVICLNTESIFNSIKDACKYTNLVGDSGIIYCCQGKRKSCGTDPITGEKLHWMYYDEYLKNKEPTI